MIGSTAGHYEILEKLGEGGMGVVYKARDVLLNRVAALKFLPVDGGDADDKRSRFIKEAQSASALNHPNIVTIYEVAGAGGRDFIAMELVQGQTLDQRIGRKGLPLARALDYAMQIADALAAAHAAGIVHRDLKPANVMVTDKGLVKVLDFGLAKLVQSAWNTDATQTIQTASTSSTARGIIVGTVAYMSPEQADGKPVDHRSDIFSFGALLHEMLTGRRAFQGESAASTLAAILTAEPPPLSGDLAGAPAELVRIVARCLRKSPEKRWQSLADVRIALEELQADLASGRLASSAAGGPTPSLRGGRGWMPAVVAALAAAAITGSVAWWLGRSVPQPPDLWQIGRLTGDAGLSLSPALSRDGKLVSYVSDRAGADSMDLWVQQVDGGDPVQLTRGLGACGPSDFSPDGSRIAVHCGGDPGDIYIVPALGGLPKRVGEGEWPRFSPDGSRISSVIFASGGGSPSMKIVPVNGGAATELKPGKGITSAPIWRPDGMGLLFVGLNESPSAGEKPFDWYYAPVDGGPITAIGVFERLSALDVGPGRNLAITHGGVLFAHGNADSSNIYRLPFNPSFTTVAGPPVPIVVGSGFNFAPTSSQNGTRIAFAVGTNVSNNIWRAAIDPRTGVVGSPLRITNGVDPSVMPSPSRDGRRIAYLGSARRAPEVRLRDVEAGTEVRLAGAKEWTYLTLSPDGSTVAFSSDQRIGSGIYVVSTSGGVPRRVCAGCGRPIEWLPGGNRLLIDGAGGDQREIHILDVSTSRTTPLLRDGGYQLTMPRVSPDGRVLAFTQVRPGRERRIYVAPFSNKDELIPEAQWSVVIQGPHLDRQPAWAPEGSTLYFLSERDGSRCIWAQRIDTATRQPIGDAVAAQHRHQLRYNLADVDVAAIGLSLASGHMFFASADVQSNIWIAERRASRQ